MDAQNRESMSMSITNVEVHEYLDNGPLIEVAATSNGKSEVFYVETLHGEYSGDCSITTLNSDGHVNQDDYPDFDLGKIADEAEKLSQSFYTKTEYYFYGRRMWIHQSSPCSFCIFEGNSDYINSQTNCYDTPFSRLIGSFFTLEEALEYAKEIADED